LILFGGIKFFSCFFDGRLLLIDFVAGLALKENKKKKKRGGKKRNDKAKD